MVDKKKIKNLTNDDILAEDIYKNSTLVIKKGTQINKKVKSSLRKFGVEEVKVTGKEKDDNKNHNELSEKASTLFYKTLLKIASEERYGIALKADYQLEWLKKLFISVVNDQQTFDILMKLKHYDRRTFEHSVDVFILGSLLYESFGKNDIKGYAKAFLLHDIGKLFINKNILQKKGNLTDDEFKAIQNHTVKGEQWFEDNGLSKYKDLAKSHHERIDGSGYPDGMIGKEHFSEALFTLMVVDVYSALTLERSYRDKLTAVEAMEILLIDQKKIPLSIIFSLMDLLKIYPPQSIVELTNGRKAEVLHVLERKPYIPLVKDLKTEESYELPTNLSVLPNKIMRWNKEKHENKQKDSWNQYIDLLIKGEKDLAIFYLEDLTDNKRVEDIYVDIIGKSMFEVGKLWETNKISVAEEHLASYLTKEIMDAKLKDYTTVNKAKGRIVLSTVGTEKHTLPLKIVADTLEANGWKVYNLLEPLPSEEMIDYLERKNLNIVGLSCTMEENIEALQEMVDLIKTKRPGTKIIVGGAGVNEHEIKQVDYVGRDAKEAVKYLEQYR